MFYTDVAFIPWVRRQKMALKKFWFIPFGAAIILAILLWNLVSTWLLV